MTPVENQHQPSRSAAEQRAATSVNTAMSYVGLMHLSAAFLALIYAIHVSASEDMLTDAWPYFVAMVACLICAHLALSSDPL